MFPDTLQNFFINIFNLIQDALTQSETYIQLGIILLCYLVAFIIQKQVFRYSPYFSNAAVKSTDTAIENMVIKLGKLLFPLLSILLLRISVDLLPLAIQQAWLLKTALTIAVLFIYISIINDFIKDRLVRALVRMIGVPLILLNAVGALDDITTILQSISVHIGNIEFSVFGIIRVLLFGTFLFWLGRVSNKTGQNLIRRQEKLDFRTREVAAKLFEIALFVGIFLLLLQVMGINLTALAVFGGAVGVGLGFGLQTIASNFISGIIILLDRSLSIGDYIEMDDGSTGTVRAMNLRSTTLETFDGKDIMVPNEQFIASTFTNWTHKNKKQRYRVDFSVAYDSDIRALVDIIKEVVATHPQVLSGEEYPIEERPDCEIDSFGDSGVNMFVEFWMEAIDDGKNRVGGDLLLMIFEAMRENGFVIPFPQREVRVLNPDNSTG